ncbi:Vps8 domain-containing protein [Caenorhabditis elegans]|nr:Vps8 domain-containing protein [Caenorhabditis elegans]CDR32774.1 Vps8 domain-containing protein [Caenorhabditis elegans]|eukprot:NP_001293992.1 related to yeast Vacuolar Protein Sorting factor [Caenorhabditis elegans]
MEVSRRAPLMHNPNCITCEQPMHKSGYVFRCGHFQHIECSTNIDRTCTCDGIPDRLVVPREKPDRPEKRNIFENWDTKLNCRVFPKDSS